jgi:hypothetical protein
VSLCYALTAEKQLEAWDSGGTCWTLEMGGLGPGYEQALQIAAMEMLRLLLRGFSRPPKLCFHADQETRNRAFEAAVKEFDGHDSLRDLRLSGAQFGAASWLALRFWVEGPRSLLTRAQGRGHADRGIQVSRYFPEAPPAPAQMVA